LVRRDHVAGDGHESPSQRAARSAGVAVGRDDQIAGSDSAGRGPYREAVGRRIAGQEDGGLANDAAGSKNAARQLTRVFRGIQAAVVSKEPGADIDVGSELAREVRFFDDLVFDAGLPSQRFGLAKDAG